MAKPRQGGAVRKPCISGRLEGAAWDLGLEGTLQKLGTSIERLAHYELCPRLAALGKVR